MDKKKDLQRKGSAANDSSSGLSHIKAVNARNQTTTPPYHGALHSSEINLSHGNKMPQKTLLGNSRTAKQALNHDAMDGVAYQSLPAVGELTDKHDMNQYQSHPNGLANAAGKGVSKLNTAALDNQMPSSLNRVLANQESQDTGFRISKFSGHQSPEIRVEQDLPVKDTLSMGQESKRTTDGDALVKFGVDMSELSDYLENIIQVVNQHAKLLDKVSDELEARPKAKVVGELFSALGQTYPYDRQMQQLNLQSHVPRNAKVCEILSQHKVSLTAQMRYQLDQPVTNMWEGMERFMKAVDVIGRSNTELLQFMHASEFKFDKHEAEIQNCVPRPEFESALNNLKNIMESKMQAQITEFETQVNRLTKKTEKRLDGFDKNLKEVEANTYWKIKDYEKLLEARPTMQYVKSAMQEEGRNVFNASRVYTDEQIQRMKESEGALVKQFDAFKTLTNSSLRDFEGLIGQQEKNLEEKDAELRDFVRKIEHGLLTKIDEIHYKADKLSEQMKNVQDDNSSLQQSTRVKATMIAAPVLNAAASVTQNSEPRSPSPGGGSKKKGISQEHLTAIYDAINQVQSTLVNKLNEVDKLRSNLSKEVKELQKQITTKASKDSVIDGQQQFFEDLNKVEAEVEKKRDQLLMEEFKRLGDKVVAENTQLDLRIKVLENGNNEGKIKQMLDAKLDKAEFVNFVSMLTEETISPMQKEIDKSKKDIACIESFLENLSQAIKALEMASQNQEMKQADNGLESLNASNIAMKLAAGRYKSLDPQNCLSCGEFEMTQVANKGLIGIHAKNGTSIEFSPTRQQQYDNTAYGQIDTKGWSGLTRIHSIEGNFGGGEDPSNKAIRRNLTKTQRPTSANPHHMRSVNKAALMNNATYQDQLKFDGSSKYINRTGGGMINGNKTISTAAVTNPNYNATLMSQKFKNTMRKTRAGTTGQRTMSSHFAKSGEYANQAMLHQQLGSQKNSNTSVQTLAQNSANSLALQLQTHTNNLIQSTTANQTQLPQMVGLIKGQTGPPSQNQGISGVYIGDLTAQYNNTGIERVFQREGDE